MQNSVSTQLEAVAFTDHIQQLMEGFTGRLHILKEIDHWLQQKDQRSFMLTGEPGVGKSVIAACLTQTYEDIVAYHFSQAAELETLKPVRFLRSPLKPKQL